MGQLFSTFPGYRQWADKVIVILGGTGNMVQEWTQQNNDNRLISLI